MSAAEKINPAIQIKLRALKGPHAGQSFHITKDAFTIGRGPENEVVLINDAQISRQHVRLQVVGQDVEIINLSKTNSVLVGAEIVNKWKLVNDATFTIGESELQITFDLGKVVNPEPLQSHIQQINTPPVVRKKPQAVAQRKNHAPKVNKANNAVAARMRMQPPPPPQFYQQKPPQFSAQNIAAPNNVSGGHTNNSLLAHPKFKFYLVLGLVVLGLVYWLMDSETPQSNAKKEIKSTLKYEDEYAIKQNSINEKELDQKRKAQLDQKNSPTVLRINENFQKGMRDYQLGNYTRALDHFQVVLNLDPTHALAKRHLYLSKIRFDEIVKTKLILGESYYQKHNFKMCEAMFQQVMIMLQGKNQDLNFQKAQSMSDKCRLAAEGIR